MTRTALQWAKHNRGCAKAIAWLKRQRPITMSEAYRRCHNVAWMWFALYLTVRMCGYPGYPNRLTDARKSQLNYTMEAFYREFWEANSGVSSANHCISCANLFLDNQQLQYWADRLREYVVPR